MERISPSTAGLTQRIGEYVIAKKYDEKKSKNEAYRILKRNELMSCGQNQY